MALAFTGFGLGVLIGPPFGSVVFQFLGVEVPFYILAGIGAFDGIIQLLTYQVCFQITRQITRNELEACCYQDDLSVNCPFCFLQTLNHLGQTRFKPHQTDPAASLKKQESTSLLELLADPYILLTSVTMATANICIAFLETGSLKEGHMKV